MGRLAKTAIALVGIASIGGFVSLLGGPNVFSTFSNAISTILPESEVAVEKTEETKTQDKVPTQPEPEERKELLTEITESAKEEIAAITITETSQAVAAITKEPEVKPQVQSQVISSVAPSAPSPTPKAEAQRSAKGATGGGSSNAPSRTQGSGSQGFGRWCATSSGVTFIEEGGTCMGWRLKDGELVEAY